MDNNRRTAYEVLMAVETEGAYSNIALNDAVKRRSPDDEAFVGTLVYGVIENQIYLDYKRYAFRPYRTEKSQTSGADSDAYGRLSAAFWSSSEEFRIMPPSAKR